MDKLTRMKWEKPYLEALINALRPSGNVLEVGFGLGYSATHIQTYHPTHHTIIEWRPEVAKKALQWAKKRPNATVIQDTWENALPKLGLFDAIFFNDFDPEAETEIQQMRDMSSLVLTKEKELSALVAETLPQLTTIRYSDQDIEEFYQQAGQFNLQDLSRFLFTLKSNGQITETQYEKMIKKYQLEKNEIKTAGSPIRKPVDQSFLFLQACVKDHMKKGSRFSSFSISPRSKFENAQFFEHVITNPHLDYQEKIIPVEVPESCSYYKYQEALVLVIEKL
ncbi:MAG TPA: hypothetical protein VLF61_00695 [Rhabdochlamydiaceae bacterium]|nr:hypothetical protein [Rhabdochlamydiaceae bacterium]